MPTKPSSFRKTDVVRAVSALRSAGFDIARVEVDASGKITVVPGSKATNDTDGNPWDQGDAQNQKRPA
jgi:hypothetical protein